MIRTLTYWKTRFQQYTKSICQVYINWNTDCISIFEISWFWLSFPITIPMKNHRMNLSVDTRVSQCSRWDQKRSASCCSGRTRTRSRRPPGAEARTTTLCKNQCSPRERGTWRAGSSRTQCPSTRWGRRKGPTWEHCSKWQSIINWQINDVLKRTRQHWKESFES